MSGEGDEPFRPYSQEDPPVQSGFYHLLSSGLDLNNYLGSSSTEPPPSGSIVAPPHSYSGYDATASFLPASHSAAVAHGGMSGAAHGYSGYGVPMGQYQFPHHSGVFPMADPARHSTSSLAGFHGVPYASLPPIPRPPARTGYGAYGEGSSHRAARVDMGPFPTVSHHAAMGDDSAYSGVPGRRMNRSQSLRQAPSPVHDVCSNDNSMASDSGDDDSSSASSAGDNAALIGDISGHQQDEGNDDRLEAEDDGTTSEDNISWASDEDSSEDDEELYKTWENMFGKDNLVYKVMKIVRQSSRTRIKLFKQAVLLGMYHESLFCKRPRRVVVDTGIAWVERTLCRPSACYNMFRMDAHVFESLHQELVDKYGLESTRKMSSKEALAMFLYMVGPPEPVRQAENRFERSMETVSRKFNHVLDCVTKLAQDIVAPKDPTFSSVHPKVANHRSAPFFNNAIGALDGTHVKVVIPFGKVGQYINRKNDKTQNVLAICDFDRRFTFVAAGIPGSAHDWTVLQEAMIRYGEKFPHAPSGKFYLVDAGYPNRPGFLSPYKGFKYHQQQWRHGPAPSGEKEVFNKAHSSLRSVIEQSFGVLKMKWRILLGIPSYPERTQSKIILACCGLHNFILDHDDDDTDFHVAASLRRLRVDDDDEEEQERREADEVDDDINMNALRDEIAHAYYMAQRRC